ncbi:MAG TPA: hypothetical protein VGM56_09285 [Byssovorax sp.]|jgi:hypothetical protein
MRKAEIDALVRAHGGRERPVAFFHILRQAALEADDHAFLLEHAAELGASDLLRWRARCEPGLTGPVIRQLARRAIANPDAFHHEVLDLPRIELGDEEWRELADLVRGKAPQAIVDGIVARGGPRPERPPASFFFTPGKLDRAGLDDAAPALDLRAVDVAALSQRGVDTLSMREIVALHAAGAPIDEATMIRAAASRAADEAEDWSGAVVDFPPSLEAAVTARARSTSRGAERANLLTWLDARGVARAALFTIALAPLPRGEPSSGVVAWLAERLTTRAAWERHGFEVASSLVAARSFSELGEIIAVVVSRTAREEPSRGRAVLAAIQASFALTLVEAARAAVASRDDPRAAAALSALACLDPPARVSGAVHELGAAAASAHASADVIELVALNARLVKHGGRDASLEGLVAALHAVADAFGS